MKLLPADRLPPVAARIVTAQAQPPRRVALGDVLEFSWPVLVYLPVPPLVLAALLLLINANHWYLVFVALLGVLTVGAWLGLQILPLVLALRRGLMDVGTVVDVAVLPRGGSRGHVVLERGTGGRPVEFYALSLHALKTGDRLKVLVDPTAGKVSAALEVMS